MNSFRELLIACIAFAGFIGGALEGYWLTRILANWLHSRKKDKP